MQKRNELFIFSQDDNLLTILSLETGLLSTKYREELNQVSNEPFTFTIEGDAEKAVHIVEENQVVFWDKEEELQLFVIKEIDAIDGMDAPEITAICEPAFMELAEHIVVDRRMVDDTADIALNAALDGTRWTGIVEASLGNMTQNFYYISSIEAIWKILEVWGGEFKAVVEYDGTNTITDRIIKIKQRRGSDTGLRWEIGFNTEEIQRTVLSYPITAMYGRGASLQTEGGGHSRYIDFADVEWQLAYNDPASKPIGQRWVGDNEALQKYGRVHNGELLHREGIFSDQNIEDQNELLLATWRALQEAKEPQMNYKLSVYLLEFLAGYEHQHVQLGDTNYAIDRNFARPIEIEARVIALEYDILDIENTAVAEMGQFLSILNDNRLERVIDDINTNRDQWENSGGDSDVEFMPDIKPPRPQQVEAHGGFQTIQVYWHYDAQLYIKHYELYASQSADFVPSAENIVYTGDVSAFAHEVETDQVWYYYVRSVNYHGTYSDFSAQVSAATVRIISDDILFGEIIADHLENNLDIADKLAQNTIDFINQEPIEYTDEQITQTRNNLLEEIADKADLEYVNGELKSDIIGDVHTEIDESLSGYVRVTDYQTDQNGIVQRLNSNQSSIEQNENEIESKVDSSEFNSVTGELSSDVSTLQQRSNQIFSTVSTFAFDTDQRMTKSESSITQLSNEIELKVDEDGVIAAINLSSEGVRINGNRHHITGQTLIDDAVIGTAAIANSAITNAKLGTAVVDTAQIASGAITNAKVANATIDSAKIANLDASKINSGTIEGVEIKTANNNFHLYLKDQVLDFVNYGTNKLSIGFRDENGNSTNEPYFIIGSGNSQGRDKLIWEKMVERVEMRYSTANGDWSAMNFNYSGDLSFRAANTMWLTGQQLSIMMPIRTTYLATFDTASINRVTASNNNVDISPNNSANYGRLEVVSRTNTSQYRPVRALSFDAQSTEKIKTNFVELDSDKILNKYKNHMTIYEYNLKEDIEAGKYKKQYGMVIGNGRKTPAELTDGETIDIYSFTSWNASAIQGLIQKDDKKDQLIEQLFDEINVLKTKVG